MTEVEGINTLSIRGAENAGRPDHWEPLIRALANPWAPTNPDGMVILGLAESSLMHQELKEHIKKNFDIDTAEHFTYGHGSQGSPRLLNALSNYFNNHFHPLEPTLPSNFIVTSGVSGTIDEITWSICNEGEGISFPLPRYTGFANDVPTRSRGKLVLVPFEREDGTLDLNDVFDPEANTRCLERAYQEAEKEGSKVKAVMITNPHNPIGKCYPTATLTAIATFCTSHNLHYLSDEIYAMSTFSNPSHPNATTFTSVLSLSLPLPPTRMHVLYGAAKDFSSNGLRLGAFYSRNEALLRSVKSINTFSWIPYIVQDTWARILEDTKFLDWFIAENQRRLQKNFGIMTEFFEKEGIPFFEGSNAALFVWVDLRQWFLDDPEKDDIAVLKATAPGVEKYVAKQDLLSKAWQAKGVMIGKGTAFLTEEVGWVRVVFSAQEEALRVGLQRFVDVLRDLKADGQL